jgi:hypothetical protein
MKDNRKYYGQECQDDELNKKFRDLHHALVDLVISFCKENDIDIDEASLSIDGISASIPYGQWEACTDSSLVFNKEIAHKGEEQEPFIYSM